jgi:ankyrin repeat protein
MLSPIHKQCDMLAGLEPQSAWKEWLLDKKSSELHVHVKDRESGGDVISGRFFDSLRAVQPCTVYYSLGGMDLQRLSPVALVSSLIIQVLNMDTRRFGKMSGLYKSLEAHSLWTRRSLSTFFASLLDENGVDVIFLVVDNLGKSDRMPQSPLYKQDSLLRDLMECSRDRSGDTRLKIIFLQGDDNANTAVGISMDGRDTEPASDTADGSDTNSPVIDTFRGTDSREADGSPKKNRAPPHLRLGASTIWRETRESAVSESIVEMVQIHPNVEDFRSDIETALAKCKDAPQLLLSTWSLMNHLRSSMIEHNSVEVHIGTLPRNGSYIRLSRLPAWARIAIGWILHSKRPLTLKELAAAVVLDQPDQETMQLPSKGIAFLNLPAELEQAFGPLVRIENNQVVLAHESVADSIHKVVLVEHARGVNAKTLAGASVRIPNDRSITLVLLKYLSCNTVAKSIKESLKTDAWKGSNDSVFDLVDYAVHFWSEHCLCAQSDESFARDVVKFLKNEPLIQVMTELDSQRCSTSYSLMDPLCLAAKYGLYGLVEVLLTSTTQADNNLAIALAGSGGHLNIVKMLVEKLQRSSDLADLLKCDLGLALKYSSLHGHEPVVRYLLDQTKESQFMELADELLVCAAEIGYQRQIELFVERGASVDSVYQGATPLQLAARNGHAAIVRFLLQRKADPDSKNSKSPVTAIHHAAEYGHMSVVECLLEFKASRTLRDGNGRTPLHLAAQQGHCEVIHRLLEKNSQSRNSETDGTAPPPLTNGLLHSNGNLACADEAAEQASDAADTSGIKVEDLRESTEIEWQYNDTTMPGHYSTSVALGSSGSPITCLDQKDDHGDTPLQLASRNGHLNAVHILMEAGAKLDLTNDDGHTPLYAAVSQRHALTAEAIMEKAELKMKFADVTAVLVEAAKAGFTDIIRLSLDKQLVTAEKLKSEDSNGRTLFHDASERGRTSTMSLLLDHGVDIEKASDDGETALTLAAMAGKPDAVRLLIDHLELSHWHKDGVRLLFRLASSKNIETSVGHANVVRHLLEKKNAIDPDKHDEHHNTALIRATVTGNILIAEALLECGANPSLKDGVEDGPLFVAAAHGRLDIIKLLLRRGALPLACHYRGWTAMHIASRDQGPDVLEVLFRACPDLLEQGTRSGRTPLHCASRNPASTEWLVKQGADIDAKGDDGDTALMLASRCGSIQVVELLLMHHARLDLVNKEGKTALHHAAENGHWMLAEKLLDADEDMVTINAPDQNGRTALSIAIAEDERDFVFGILGEKYGKTVQVNLEDRNGDTPLILAVKTSNRQVVDVLLNRQVDTKLRNKNRESALVAAVKDDQPALVTMLLDHNRPNHADVDSGGGPNPTALYAAAQSGNVDAVRQLLGLGADVNATGGVFNTALVVAADGGWDEVVELLLERGADPNLDGGAVANALCAAISSGLFFHCMDDLLDSDHAVNKADAQGRTAMHMAARRGSLEIFRILLSHEGDAERLDRQGRSVVHHAAMSGSLEVVMFLDESGHELDAVDRDGWTPLHWACRSEMNESVVQYLFDRMGDKTMPTEHGWTPQNIAIFHDSAGLLDMIGSPDDEQDSQPWAVGSRQIGITCDGCMQEVRDADIRCAC